jgi:hypothetical protein
LQLDAFDVCCRAKCVKCGFDDGCEIEWMQIEPEIAGDDA